MITIDTDGYINANGRLQINAESKPLFLQQIAKQAGKSVTVNVKIDGKKRSTRENAYYWGIVVGLVQAAISEEWGETITKEDTHQILKQYCNYREYINENTGESIKVAQHTSNLSTTQFEDYLERCRQFAADYLNIVVPEPNTQISIFE